MNHVTFRTVGLVALLFVCIGLLAGCQSMNEKLNPRPPVLKLISIWPAPNS